jgi:transcription antitermination factor NusG
MAPAVLWTLTVRDARRARKGSRNGREIAVAMTSLTVPAAVPPEARRHEWFVLVVKPRHEKSAEQILSKKGFETFLPLQTRRHRYEGRQREFQFPLFPGYVFCRFDPQWSMPVLSTPSVSGVVGAGHRPLPVDAAELESLRIASASPYRLNLHPYLEAGSKVRINEGPLTGVTGTVLEEKDSRRLVLSISILQRSVEVVLDRDSLSAE